MDEADNPLREAPATLGATLAAERERQGLSRADVAHRLHMSPMQVEALEVGDYASLPKGTFLRGFVRNYAKALGLAPEPLIESLAGAAPSTPAPGIVVPTQNIRFDPLGERFSSPYVKAATLAAVAIAIGFAAMYWAMYVRPRPPALRVGPVPAAPTGPASTAAPPEPATSATPPAETPPPAPAPLAAPGAAPGGSHTSPAQTEPASAQNAPASAASEAKAPAKATPAKTAAGTKAPSAAGANVASADGAGAALRLNFRFVGDSWVEVRDASGAVLFQKLNAAGTEAQVSGHPPLQVIVGNAPEVEMTLDGKPFDLDPHTNVAVARFTLE